MVALTLLALAVLTVATPASAAPVVDDATAVRAAVESWFSAMRSKDRAAFESHMLPDATFITLRDSAEGWTRIHRTRKALTDMLMANTGTIIERFTAPPTVLVHGPMATVWGAYDFSVDGKRQHCGVDGFDLEKDGDTWKIASARWTVEPKGCPQ